MTASDSRSQLCQLQVMHHHEAYGRPVGDDEPLSWIQEDSADAWGNRLCLEDIAPVLSHYAPASMVTIGDGRWGREGHFLRNLGHRVCSTDICGDALAIAKQRGYIDDFSEENAEQLSFEDNSFDFALAKETLHHMQRPYLAIYEMLRVARRGIVLIEPHYHRPTGIKACAKQILRELLGLNRKLMRGLLPKAVYEDCGNYLFRFNPFDLTQCSLALGLPWVAFGYAHHFWEPGCGEITGPALEPFIQQKRREMARRDARRGKAFRPLLTFFIFKQPIEAKLRSLLLKADFQVPELPQNPALTKSSRAA